MKTGIERRVNNPSTWSTSVARLDATAGMDPQPASCGPMNQATTRATAVAITQMIVARSRCLGSFMIYLDRASLLLAGEFAPVACSGSGLHDIDGARHIALGRHRAAKTVEA